VTLLIQRAHREGGKIGVATEGIEANLLTQLARVFRHTRQGSIETRRRYWEACRRFVHFLAERFRLQKLANLQDKHIRAYVEDMLARGLAPATVKADLAAIRFLHDQLPDARHRLSDNKDLGVAIPRRRFRGLGRAWTDEEFEAMIARARARGRQDVVLVLTLCRWAGLRIHETMRLDWATARQGLTTGQLHVKGKGGRERDVPLSPAAREALMEAFLRTRPGQKLFVPAGVPTHRAIARVRSFVYRYRIEVQRKDRRASLTPHGLRHTYAAERYRFHLDVAGSRRLAELRVARLLGHNRPEVTRGYL
jgi:integrase